MTYHSCTLKTIYDGKLTQISCPAVVKYEDFIEIAMKRFMIAIEFRDFIEISSGHRYIFEKDTFENYLLLFPNPKVTFEIAVNYKLLLDDLHLYMLNPLDSSGKRKNYDEADPDLEGVNLFTQTADEPQVMRPKIDYAGDRNVVK